MVSSTSKAVENNSTTEDEFEFGFKLESGTLCGTYLVVGTCFHAAIICAVDHSVQSAKDPNKIDSWRRSSAKCTLHRLQLLVTCTVWRSKLGPNYN